MCVWAPEYVLGFKVDIHNHPHLFSDFSFFGVKIDLQLFFSKKRRCQWDNSLNDGFSTIFPESSIYLHHFPYFSIYFQNLHFQQTHFPTANFHAPRRRPLVRAQKRGPGGAERSRRGAPWQFQDPGASVKKLLMVPSGYWTVCHGKIHHFL